ncbi:hypothetical protein [Brevibacillus migulae]|uniref:hypothetical protein n=1 Tax=Brevibacillus migulae TaxID=1644114 RepID=UPI001430CB4E|nr:hypothetical protein [Brevibacillus migulae]
MNNNSNNEESNEKELAFLQKEFGIVNPSPNQLKQQLKELASKKVISKYTIKSDKG